VINLGGGGSWLGSLDTLPDPVNGEDSLASTTGRRHARGSNFAPAAFSPSATDRAFGCISFCRQHGRSRPSGVASLVLFTLAALGLSCSTTGSELSSEDCSGAGAQQDGILALGATAFSFFLACSRQPEPQQPPQGE